MAGLEFDVVTPTGHTTGTSAKTILQVVAPASQEVDVLEWKVSFQYNDATKNGCLVEILQQDDSAGSGSATAVTPSKDQTKSATVQSTAWADFTGTTQPTPTTNGVKDRLYVELKNGGYTHVGGKIPCPGGKRVGIKITSPVDVPVLASFHCVE